MSKGQANAATPLVTSVTTRANIAGKNTGQDKSYYSHFNSEVNCKEWLDYVWDEIARDLSCGSSGTTAVAAIYDKSEEKKIHIKSQGDSNCYAIFYNGEEEKYVIRKLNVLHDVSNSFEDTSNRVENGQNSVCGTGMSRSFGDGPCTNHTNPESEQPYESFEAPDGDITFEGGAFNVSEFEKEKGLRFIGLITVSDGLMAENNRYDENSSSKWLENLINDEQVTLDQEGLTQFMKTTLPEAAKKLKIEDDTTFNLLLDANVNENERVVVASFDGHGDSGTVASHNAAKFLGMHVENADEFQKSEKNWLNLEKCWELAEEQIIEMVIRHVEAENLRENESIKAKIAELEKSYNNYYNEFKALKKKKGKEFRSARDNAYNNRKKTKEKIKELKNLQNQPEMDDFFGRDDLLTEYNDNYKKPEVSKSFDSPQDYMIDLPTQINKFYRHINTSGKKHLKAYCTHEALYLLAATLEDHMHYYLSDNINPTDKQADQREEVQKFFGNIQIILGGIEEVELEPRVLLYNQLKDITAKFATIYFITLDEQEAEYRGLTKEDCETLQNSFTKFAEGFNEMVKKGNIDIDKIDQLNVELMKSIEKTSIGNSLSEDASVDSHSIEGNSDVSSSLTEASAEKGQSNIEKIKNKLSQRLPNINKNLKSGPQPGNNHGMGR